MRVQLGMEDGAYWQREVDPRATLWILPSASLRRCNETREPGYTRLKRSRISGTMGHQLESLELSPWTRSIRAFQLQSGERHSYVRYLTEFPVAVFDSNRCPAWQSKCYSRPERRGPPAAGPLAYITYLADGLTELPSEGASASARLEQDLRRRWTAAPVGQCSGRCRL